MIVLLALLRGLRRDNIVAASRCDAARVIARISERERERWLDGTSPGAGVPIRRRMRAYPAAWAGVSRCVTECLSCSQPLLSPKA